MPTLRAQLDPPSEPRTTLGDANRLKRAGRPLPADYLEAAEKNAEAIRSIVEKVVAHAPDRATTKRAEALYRAASVRERRRLENMTAQEIVTAYGRRTAPRKGAKRTARPSGRRGAAATRAGPDSSPSDPSPLPAAARRGVERAFLDALRRNEGGKWAVVAAPPRRR